jgi:hypothetical protein
VNRSAFPTFASLSETPEASSFAEALEDTSSGESAFGVAGKRDVSHVDLSAIVPAALRPNGVWVFGGTAAEAAAADYGAPLRPSSTIPLRSAAAQASRSRGAASILDVHLFLFSFRV